MIEPDAPVRPANRRWYRKLVASDAVLPIGGNAPHELWLREAGGALPDGRSGRVVLHAFAAQSATRNTLIRPKSLRLVVLKESWCPGEDSNLHALASAST